MKLKVNYWLNAQNRQEERLEGMRCFFAGPLTLILVQVQVLVLALDLSLIRDCRLWATEDLRQHVKTVGSSGKG